MSFELGLFTEYDDSNSIAYADIVARASAVPLSAFKGAFYNSMLNMQAQVMTKDFEIYNRTKTQRVGTVGVAGWDNSATTNLDVTSTAGLIKGQTLLIEDEVVIVDSITSATKIAVIARGAGGTTAATHAAAVPYKAYGSAINDTDLKNINSVNEITGVYKNFMQTVAEPLDFTKSAQILKRKGLNDAQILNVLRQEAMNRVVEGISSSSILGYKQEGDGTSPYMTAGLIQQMLDDANGNRPVLTASASSAPISEAILRGALRDVTQQGMPTDIFVSSANKELINGFKAVTAKNYTINSEQSNSVAGYHVDSYDYEGLMLNVKIDADMPDDKIAIVNINDCRKGWLNDDLLQFHAEPDASSREKRESLNGSWGMEIENVGYDHILIEDLTLS